MRQSFHTRALHFKNYHASPIIQMICFSGFNILSINDWSESRKYWRLVELAWAKAASIVPPSVSKLYYMPFCTILVFVLIKGLDRPKCWTDEVIRRTDHYIMVADLTIALQPKGHQHDKPLILRHNLCFFSFYLLLQLWRKPCWSPSGVLMTSWGLRCPRRSMATPQETCQSPPGASSMALSSPWQTATCCPNFTFLRFVHTHMVGNK